MSSPPSIKDDEVSKRVFYAGMFGLPWLWIVHTLGWYSKQKGDGSLMNSRAEGDREAEMVALNEQMWVTRCRNSAFFVTFLWLVWVLLAQVFFTELLPSSWFVRAPDQGEYTGW